MSDWNTRLAVAVQADGGLDIDVVPVDSMSSTFNLNAEPLHTIGNTHIGVVYSPRAITFTVTVKAIGPATAQLTAIALQGRRFDIVLQERQGSDWSFKTVVMSECVITSAAETVGVAGAPTMTFSGFSLDATVEPKNGEPVSAISGGHGRG